MRRYIDAYKIPYHDLSDGKGLCQVAFLEDVMKVPPADVRENVRGEWITPTEKVYSMDGEDITFAYKECNRCHKVYVRTNDNFCPNCGADMRDGEADDESRIN